MKKVLIIGNGMMGHSFEIALKNINKYSEIHATDNIKLFRLNEVDIIFNCTGHKLNISENFIIDISSVQIENSIRNTIYCHPLCGSEKSGRENSRDDLFVGQTCIITTEGKSRKLIDVATNIFNDIGMNVYLCDTVEEHNRNLAYTSHLLHYLAFNGFADLHPVLERLSHSNKEMWEAIFKANKKNIDEALLKFTYNLALCFHNQGIQASIRELVKDILEHFYGTALKQLLK